MKSKIFSDKHENPAWDEENIPPQGLKRTSKIKRNQQPENDEESIDIFGKRSVFASSRKTKAELQSDHIDATNLRGASLKAAPAPAPAFPWEPPASQKEVEFVHKAVLEFVARTKVATVYGQFVRMLPRFVAMRLL